MASKKHVVKVSTPRAMKLSKQEHESLKEHFRSGVAQVMNYRPEPERPISEINIASHPRKPPTKKTAKGTKKKK